MDDHALTVGERLERLERENLKLKQFAWLMKFAMASVIALCAATFSVPLATGSNVKVLNAQHFNVLNSNGAVVASLGSSTDGNVLTFFDSSGRKTLTLGNGASEAFTGLLTWDNNDVIPGTGMVRTAFGESNPNIGPSAGFGAQVLDGTGKVRTAFGASYDLANSDLVAVDADGSVTGIGTFQATKFKGFFTNDNNGITRQFGGLSFDANLNDNVNLIGLEDSSGVMRVSAAQVPPDFVNSANRRGNAFVLWDSNGLQEASMSALTDGSLAGFNIVDKNNHDRFAAYLTDQFVGMNLSNDSGNVGVDGFVDSAGSQSNFAVWNNSGKIITLDGVLPSGAGFVNTYDTSGTTITGHLP